MQTILALDLGTTTGWAISIPNDGLKFTSGHLCTKGDRFEGGGMRFVNFERFLNKLHDNYKLDAVYYEEVRAHTRNAIDAAHIYGGFWGTLTRWCEIHSIPYKGIPVGTIKKHATGSGRANKDGMMWAAKRRGWQPRTHDEADAMWLLDYVTETYGR